MTPASPFPGTGHVYLADFGDLVARITFTDGQLTFLILKGLGHEGFTETVAIDPVELRPGLFLVTWQIANGATTSHLEDFENGRVHAVITRLDGTFLRKSGTWTRID
jgi:hypothetical protein